MSVNKAIILGRIGKELELKNTANGATYLQISVATSERYTDKQGQKQEKTEWHNVTAWGKQAEIIQKYFNKGDEIYLEGNIETRSYEKDGEKRYSTGIKLREFSFVSGKKSSNDSNATSNDVPKASSENNFVADDIPF